MNPTYYALLAVAYLIGSIPVGVLVARTKGVDILKFGSGNPGATNVARAVGKPLGILVFILDVAKGAIPAAIAHSVVTERAFGLHPQLFWFLAGAAAVLGHCFSPFLGFRGGKGVATSAGALLGTAPLVLLAAFVIWLVVELVTSYVSLASMVAAVAAVVLAAFWPGQARELLPVYSLLAAFVIYTHRSNIRRLLAGTESKFSLFGRGKKADPAVADEKTPRG